LDWRRVAGHPNADGHTALSLATGADSVSELVLQEAAWQVVGGSREKILSFICIPFSSCSLAEATANDNFRAAERWREAEICCTRFGYTPVEASAGLDSSLLPGAMGGEELRESTGENGDDTVLALGYGGGMRF
jgi:hypothetical protein